MGCKQVIGLAYVARGDSQGPRKGSRTIGIYDQAGNVHGVFNGCDKADAIARCAELNAAQSKPAKPAKPSEHGEVTPSFASHAPSDITIALVAWQRAKRIGDTSGIIQSGNVLAELLSRLESK